MQEAVRYQLQLHGTAMTPGDVFLSNHPAAGGSHLPDITVITPVFNEGSAQPVFFVASRGHHADIGGITPGKELHDLHLLLLSTLVSIAGFTTVKQVKIFNFACNLFASFFFLAPM